MQVLKISFLIFILSMPLSAQNFWQQTNGPYGGATVYDLLQYDDSTIFLGTGEGIIRSYDDGKSWNRIIGPDLNAQIRCLAKDYFGVLYAGRYDNVYGLKLLLKSTDQGNSWNRLNDQHDAEIRFIFIPYKDTILLGSWDMGVIRTFDGGLTWNRANNGNTYNGIYKIIQLTDGSILAGSAGGGVMKTTNWGDTWIASNTGIAPNGLGQWHASSFLEISPGNIFTGTSTGIYYTTNYGNSWVYKGNGIPFNNSAKCIIEDGMGNLYAGIDISKGVYYSTNSGDQWNHLGLGHSIYTIGWDSDQNLFAGGSGNGLYKFVFEDSSWINVYNQGYNHIEVNDLSLSSNANIVASTEYYGVHNTTNEGELWTHTNYQGYEPRAIEFINDSIILAGQYDFVNVSYDTGKTWQTTGNFEVASIYYDEVEQIIYLGSKRSLHPICGIYTSTDFGQTWSLLYEFPHINLAQWIVELYVTRDNHVILASEIAATYTGAIYHLYQSTDKGITWETIYQDYDRPVTSILQDINNTLYALAYEKLMISEDEGKSWITRISAGRTKLVSDYSGRIYKDNGIGIQCSTDKGINWYPVDNSGLNNWVNDIVINQNNRIFLATTAGVYFGEADSIVLSVEDFEPANSFYLFQNYPNPFNPVTKIRFEIPGQARNDNALVTLKVYDILGREVATLVNEEKPAGEFEVEFNAANLTTGIYFYRLKAGSYSETKKMVFLK